MSEILYTDKRKNKRKTLKEKVFNTLFNKYGYFINEWYWCLEQADKIIYENNDTTIELPKNMWETQEQFKKFADLFMRVRIQLKNKDEFISFPLVRGWFCDEEKHIAWIDFCDKYIWDYDIKNYKVKVELDLKNNPPIEIDQDKNTK